MTSEYRGVLAQIYAVARSLEHWDRVLALHDAEDVEYFSYLDRMTGRA